MSRLKVSSLDLSFGATSLHRYDPRCVSNSFKIELFANSLTATVPRWPSCGAIRCQVHFRVLNPVSWTCQHLDSILSKLRSNNHDSSKDTFGHFWGKQSALYTLVVMITRANDLRRELHTHQCMQCWLNGPLQMKDQESALLFIQVCIHNIEELRTPFPHDSRTLKYMPYLYSKRITGRNGDCIPFGGAAHQYLGMESSIPCHGHRVIGMVLLMDAICLWQPRRSSILEF